MAKAKPAKKAKKKPSRPKNKTDKKRAPKLAREAFSDIWPNERDFMARPERLRYVRKLVRSEGCVFCAAADVGVNESSLVLFQNQLAMVVMNKYPYNTGHLLILPRAHKGEMESLSDQEYTEVTRLLRETIHILKKAYGPEGLNAGINLGSAAGAGIPEHLHFHVIPRFRGDTNFFPLIAETKLVIETLEQSYQRLLPYYEELARAAAPKESAI